MDIIYFPYEDTEAPTGAVLFRGPQCRGHLPLPARGHAPDTFTLSPALPQMTVLLIELFMCVLRQAVDGVRWGVLAGWLSGTCLPHLHWSLWPPDWN